MPEPQPYPASLLRRSALLLLPLLAHARPLLEDGLQRATVLQVTWDGRALWAGGENGVPRPLRPEVHEEIHAIAREALFNASHYAQASSIELELAYGARDFVLSVRDDGRGIDADVAAAGHRSGHWGLVGMRERAAAIGGRFEMASAAGEGTWITVVVPGKSAWR